MIKISNDFNKESFFSDIKSISLTETDFKILKNEIYLVKQISFRDEVKLCTIAKINNSTNVVINNKEFKVETLQEIIDFFNSNTLSVLINQEKRKNLVEFKINLENKGKIKVK